ncbi:lambda exonuclease family protein [Breoghania sp. JC706]|uniref:lambda exonuclease family protein n=1 Tax=Breoghania sp. JC706 TaxID=3117732 RepID=UPI00300B4407
MADMEQRTEEWFAARCGKVTASRIADLTAKTKSGYAASRANYMAQLLTERLTGEVAESFSSSAMQWGTDTEPKARATYALLTGNSVAETGFILHPAIANAGASPDGLVGDTGLIEIKCPNTATHLDTLRTEKIPGKYQKQMLWQMACTGRAWCDFVSFDPRLPANLCIFLRRFGRDDDAIAAIEEDVSGFLEELDAQIRALEAKYPEAA